MSEQDGTQAIIPQRPITDDTEEWKAYWEAQGQSWRIEPEINVERQEYLTQQQNIKPNIEHDIYPFKDVELKRADVEWLLSKKEDESNLAALKGETQFKRKRLDLRAANLSGENLSGLPLGSIFGGLSGKARLSATREQRQMAGVHMERCNLQRTHLAKAKLCNAYLHEAHLESTHLEGADLSDAYLEKSILTDAHLQGTNLSGAHLEGADLKGANLKYASLQGAFFDTTTSFEETVIIADAFNISPQLADVHWGDVNLSLLDWSSIKILGDEYKTRRLVDTQGVEKPMHLLIDEYQTAVRANRQLAVVLRDQGINEHADWFAYRAQVLKRRLLWKQLHLPIILRGKDPLGWKEQVQKALSDEKVVGEIGLTRIPRRVSIMSMLVLFLFLFALVPLSLSIGMLLIGMLRLLARKLTTRKVSKRKAVTPARIRFKNSLASFKQQFFAFLAIILFFIAFLAYFWLANYFWDMFNPSAPVWLKFSVFWLFVTMLGVGCLYIIAMIQVWWIQRKGGHRSNVLILLFSFFMPVVIDQHVSSLLTDWFVLWITIIYDDLVSFGQYLFSLFLSIISGYGYKPIRTLFWYLIVIFGFATAYHIIGNIASFTDALVFSVTSFHGRGFFPSLGNPNQLLYLNDPLVRLAAVEAVVGLFIEISFIATFTQRYFGK